MATMTQGAAELLGAIIGRYGSEAEALAALAEMSASEINVLLYSVQQGRDTSPASVTEARDVLTDAVAQYAERQREVALEGTAKSLQVPDRTFAELFGKRSAGGERFAGTSQLGEPEEPGSEEVSDARRRQHAGTDANEAFLRTRGQFSAGDAAEAAAQRFRASGAYRALLDRDAVEDDPEAPTRGVPIGGPRAPRPANIQQDMRRARPGAATPDQVARYAQTSDERLPLYYPGDEYAPAAWAETRIVALQRRLVEAGLLTETFRLGYWDKTTADAYTGLLAHANAEATTWTDVLPRVQAAHEAGVEVARSEAAAAFRGVLPAFTPEDPASLRQLVRQEVRARVGREPTSAEMATFTDELASWYRQQYDAEVAGARAEIERKVGDLAAEAAPGAGLLAGMDTAQVGGQVTAPPVSAAPGAAGGLQTPPANAPAVNPGARLGEALAAKLAGEIDLLRRKGDAAVNQQTVSAIAGGLLSRAGAR